jgi:arylsulfatase A-like enzyme
MGLIQEHIMQDGARCRESRDRAVAIERLEDRVFLSAAVPDIAAAVPLAIDDRPNFVFVMADDFRYDAMGFVQASQGAAARFPWLQTPNLDRLRSQSVWVRNAFVTSSVCAPARASFLTGMYNHKNGVKGNFTPFPSQNVTYASVLRDAGYDTGYIGKWHMGLQSGQRPGFSYSASYIGQGVFNNSVFEINGKPVQTTGWVDDVTTDYATSYLKAHAATGKPFVLTVGLKAPHDPHTPPARLVGIMDGKVAKPAVNATAYPPYKSVGSQVTDAKMQAYFSTVVAVDEEVGKLMSSLKNLGLDENTVFVFTSDNGLLRGEHGENDKRLAYEESIRVPMIVRYPNLVQGGGTLNQMVLNVDMAPTFVDLAGAQVPQQMDGKSIKPLLAGQATTWRSDFFYQYFEDDGYPPPYSAPENHALRTATAKLIKYPGRPEWTQLFDLAADPYETNNLYNKPAAAALQSNMLSRYTAAAAHIGFAPVYPPAGSVFKVNFQPANRPAVPDYAIDSGQTYGARNGKVYGWSVSHTDAAFDREVNSNQLLDTVVAAKAGAKWEMAVPNGQYTVKVGVGDPSVGSTPTVYVEGSPLFVAQSLRASQYNILPVTVNVSDGRLTLGFGGSANLQTRLIYLTVSGLPVGPPPPPVAISRFNFQPAGAPFVNGYLIDAGQTYAARNGKTYGWNATHVDALFHRNANPNQLLDTLVSVKAGGKWEVAVPDGTYKVKVSVGDPSATSRNNVWIEGVQVFNYAGLAANTFSNKTVTVNVSDGRLTLGIGSAGTGLTRINFIELS